MHDPAPMTAPPPSAEAIERACRAMIAVSRPNADPDALTPAPRGQIGLIPTWRLFEHLAIAALSTLAAPAAASDADSRVWLKDVALERAAPAAATAGEAWRGRAAELLAQYDAANGAPMLAMANYGECALRMLRGILASAAPSSALPTMKPEDDWALAWIAKNLMAFRHNSGDMTYRLPQVVRAMNAAREMAPSSAQAGGGVLLPGTMTAAAADALGLMLWHTGPIAHAYRAAGHDIARKAEAEQAFVLYRALGMAVQHGERWREVMGAELEAMQRQREAASAVGAAAAGRRHD